MKGLKPAQKLVLDQMKQGWQLGSSQQAGRSGRIRVWLQKGGIGKGGDTIEVHYNTFWALYTRKLIKEVHRSFPTTIYALANTEAPPKCPICGRPHTKVPIDCIGKAGTSTQETTEMREFLKASDLWEDFCKQVEALMELLRETGR